MLKKDGLFAKKDKEQQLKKATFTMNKNTTSNEYGEKIGQKKLKKI